MQLRKYGYIFKDLGQCSKMHVFKSATLIFLMIFSKEQKSQEREMPTVLTYTYPGFVFSCLGFIEAISQHDL